MMRRAAPPSMDESRPLLSVNADDDVAIVAGEQDQQPQGSKMSKTPDAFQGPVFSELRSSVWKALEGWVPPLNPTGRAKRYWVLLMLVVCIYNGFTLPLRMAFRALWEDRVEIVVFSVFDYITDLLLLFDIVLSFRTGFLDRGVVNFRSNDMFRHYSRGWLLIDALSVVFLDVFVWKPVWLHTVFRLNRLLKLTHFNEYFGYWEASAQRLHALLMVKLLTALLLILQFLGCAFVALVYVIGFAKHGDEDEFTASIDFETAPLWDFWLFSIFWSTRAVTETGGEMAMPVTVPERLFSIFVALFILFVATAIVGSVIDLVQNANASASAFQLQMEQINTFMSNKGLSAPLQAKIRHHFKALYSRNKGDSPEKTSKLLATLPTRLRSKVSMHINGDILLKVPMFANAEPGFLFDLSQRLREESYGPGDLLCIDGQEGDEMFFISRGSVEVVVGYDLETGLGEVVSQMTEGQFFGEIALLTGAPRTATIRAKGHCTVFILTKEDMNSALSAFPRQRLDIAAQAATRLGVDTLRRNWPLIPPIRAAMRRAANQCTSLGKVEAEARDQEFYGIIDELHDGFRQISVRQGDYLIRTSPLDSTGDSDDNSSSLPFQLGARAIYFVASGTIEVLDTFGLPEGRVTVSSSLNDCAVFGISECIHNRPFRVNIRAASADCVVFALTDSAFNQILAKHSDSILPTVLRGTIQCFENRRYFLVRQRREMTRTGKQLWRIARARIRAVVWLSGNGRKRGPTELSSKQKEHGRTHEHHRDWLLGVRKLAHDAGTMGVLTTTKSSLDSLTQEQLLTVVRSLSMARVDLAEGICGKIERHRNAHVHVHQETAGDHADATSEL